MFLQPKPRNPKSATETETDSKFFFATETRNRNLATETDSRIFCNRNRKLTTETDFSCENIALWIRKLATETDSKNFATETESLQPKPIQIFFATETDKPNRKPLDTEIFGVCLWHKWRAPTMISQLSNALQNFIFHDFFSLLTKSLVQ